MTLVADDEHIPWVRRPVNENVPLDPPHPTGAKYGTVLVKLLVLRDNLSVPDVDHPIKSAPELYMPVFGSPDQE